MTSRWPCVAVCVVALLPAGCGPRAIATRPAPQGEEFSLELAGEFRIPHGTPLPGDAGLRIGGLSGLVLDRASGRLLAISDARDRTRVVVFDVGGEGPSFRVTAERTIWLERPAGSPVTPDLEAIALDSDGTLLVASEGDGDREPRVPPAIFVFDQEGRSRGALPVPPRFVPNLRGALTTGARRNAAFESLTLAPDGSRLFTASESPLAQDDGEATFQRGARTRLLEYVRTPGGSWAPGREFVYPLDPVARGDFAPRVWINGLVELLALDDGDLLVMERSFASAGADGPSLNRIRIFQVSLLGASDVSAYASLRTAPEAVPLTKRLILDLTSLRGLSPKLAALDNFEGLAFGPRLADGHSSLIVVSDDNFSPRQVTAFLLLRIVGNTAGTR